MTCAKLTLILALMFASLLLLQSPLLAGSPGESGTSIRLDCPGPIGVPSQDTTVTVDLYITNSKALGGLSLGFKYAGDGIKLKDVMPSDDLPKAGQFLTSRHDKKNQVLLGWVDFSARAPLPVGKDVKFCTLTFDVPKGAKAQRIDIDSSFVAPAGYWVCSVSGGGQLRPEYIDCGAADIVIGTPSVKSGL